MASVKIHFRKRTATFGAEGIDADAFSAFTLDWVFMLRRLNGFETPTYLSPMFTE